MQALDNEFFEAYKRLDRLCSDMYGCQNGVSQYIKSMESQSYSGQLMVPSWELSYKTLKHRRWVRNQIAHNPGQFQICAERDIQDVNRFYADIMSGQDPLTRLRKRREAYRSAIAKKPSRPAKSAAAPPASDRRSTPPPAGHTTPPGHTSPPTGRTGCFATIILILWALLTIAYLLVHFQ